MADGVLPSFLEPAKKIPMVSTTDVGRTAAGLLGDDFTGKRIVELRGPQDWSANDVAAAFGKVLGRPVATAFVPPEARAAVLAGAGVPREVADALLGMYDGIASGRVEHRSRNRTASRLRCAGRCRCPDGAEHGSKCRWSGGLRLKGFEDNAEAAQPAAIPRNGRRPAGKGWTRSPLWAKIRHTGELSLKDNLLSVEVNALGSTKAIVLRSTAGWIMAGYALTPGCRSPPRLRNSGHWGCADATTIDGLA